MADCFKGSMLCEENPRDPIREMVGEGASLLLGPVARSLVSANRWLRGIKMYRFPWYLTLVSTNHASSNPGLSVTTNNQK